jgi:hypothetical protein
MAAKCMMITSSSNWYHWVCFCGGKSITFFRRIEQIDDFLVPPFGVRFQVVVDRMGNPSSCQFSPFAIHVFVAAARCPTFFPLLLPYLGIYGLGFSQLKIPSNQIGNCERCSMWISYLDMWVLSKSLTISYHPSQSG